MNRPKRAESLSHRAGEVGEYIWKRKRKKERNEKEARRERTDNRNAGERGRTEQCADDRGVPWREGSVGHGPAQMIGECRGTI